MDQQNGGLVIETKTKREYIFKGGKLVKTPDRRIETFIWFQDNANNQTKKHKKWQLPPWLQKLWKAVEDAT